jgi:ABC-type tungstate transport system permease subunit
MVSTTNILYDTGILDEVEKVFETENPMDLYFISVGTDLAELEGRRTRELSGDEQQHRELR